MSKEAVLLNVARNALLVAGHEMGADGDHWPVIKATIYGLAKDFEQLQIERNVSAELEKHLFASLNQYEKALTDCPPDLAKELRPILDQMWDLFHARFDAVSEKDDQAVDETPEGFTPWRSADQIIKELEADDEQQK